MTLSAVDGLIWIIVIFLPLLFAQRRLHWELQAVFLLVTRRPGLALGLFSFLFFPGVVLHETSHFVMAKLLGVRTGRFSLLPKVLPGGKLRLGYVETSKSDPIRDSLIGTAPLICGAVVIMLVGVNRLGMIALWDSVTAQQWSSFWAVLAALPAQPDFWVWFYLAFTVSSTMLPSASDRQSWLAAGIGLAVLLVLALLAGGGPWMAINIAPGLNRGFHALAGVFGISLVLHIILLLPVWLMRAALSKVTGLQVTA